MENLRRSYFYALAANTLSNDDFANNTFKDYPISKLFKFSSELLSTLEDLVFSESKFEPAKFLKQSEKIMNDYNYLFKDFNISKLNIENITDKYELYKVIVKKLSEFHNKIFDKNFNFNREEYYEKNIFKNDSKIKTFLSYAYTDKGISFALFIYFYINGGFLYVDWMWNSKMDNGLQIKNVLIKELNTSKQFLFLRFINSELPISTSKSSGQIRQWCSWEIGTYFKINPSKKYLVSFFDEEKHASKRNQLLDDFKIMHNVSNGIIK